MNKLKNIIDKLKANGLQLTVIGALVLTVFSLNSPGACFVIGFFGGVLLAMINEGDL